MTDPVVLELGIDDCNYVYRLYESGRSEVRCGDGEPWLDMESNDLVNVMANEIKSLRAERDRMIKELNDQKCQFVKTLEPAAKYLHAYLDRPPQTPEARSLLADIDDTLNMYQ